MAHENSRALKRRPAQPKRGDRTRHIVRLLLLLFAGVVVIDALVGDQGLLAMVRAERQYNQIAAGIARQQAENAKLRDLARRLRDDPATIEDIARRELGLIRPGEKLFVVKDLPSPGTNSNHTP